MSGDSSIQFTQALKRCTACGSRCTATLPTTALAQVVKEVVAELAPSGWRDSTLPQDCPAETLLLILTYSYACGVFGSEGIAEELWDRAGRCALVDQLAIDALSLARFRRENRALLRRCLAAVLRRRNTPRRRGQGPEGGEALESAEHPVWPDPPIDPEGEAEKRIALAAQADSEERDL